VSEIIDLVAHKKPNIKAIEINAIPEDSQSVWLDGSFSDKSIRAAYQKFQFSSNDAAGLLRAQENYASLVNTNFTMLDITQPGFTGSVDRDFDLAIVRLPTLLSPTLPTVLENVRSFLSEDGYLVLLEHGWSCADSDFEGCRCPGE
jgi:hypothetical protein